MATILKLLLEFLRILRLARDYSKRSLGRCASLLTFLGHRLRILWRLGIGYPSTSRTPKQPEPRFFGTRASAYSVSGGSTVSREYVVAASTVPDSANYPNSQERAERQTATAAPTVPPPTQASLAVDHRHTPNPPQSFDERILANRSSGNLSLSVVSLQSRTSDRFSIITASRESARASPLGQPSRLTRSVHRQFGRGPDFSRSRDRLSRSPSLTNHRLTPQEPPRLEVITANLPHISYGDDRLSPVIQPTASSYTHEPLSPPPMDGNRRKQSSTSVVFNVQNPSTDSLPLSSSTNPPQITGEPFALDSATAHSSPVTAAADLHDEAWIHSPPASISDYILPEGRFVQLINSDQIPRYSKNVTMQVRNTIILLYLLHCWQIPRRDGIRCEAFNNFVSLVRDNMNGIVQSQLTSLQLYRAERP